MKDKRTSKPKVNPGNLSNDRRQQQETINEATAEKQQSIQQATVVNTHSGELRAYFANPPQTGGWRILSPRVDLNLEEARRIVAEGDFDGLKPEKLHF